MSEQDLVTRVLAGDPGAEREFYDTHVDRVYRLAFRMTGDQGMAEDLTQDTFLRAFDKLAGFRGESALSTWIHAVAMSVILTGLRKVARRRQHETPTEVPESLPVGQSMTNPHLSIRLTRAIDGLSEALRAVFIMHDLEGYKHREIADILDIPAGTSKARLSRAHEKLRQTLSEAYG